MENDYRADPILGEALRYWQHKRGTRRMPARRDIDPTDIPRLLPHLQMIDVVNGGARFRYRLIGTAVVTAFGHDYTGRFLDEQFIGARREIMETVYRTIYQARSPIFLRNAYRTETDLAIVVTRIFLPLSADGEHVSMIIGACKFDFGERGAAGTWGSATLDGTRYHLEIIEPDLSSSTLAPTSAKSRQPVMDSNV